MGDRIRLIGGSVTPDPPDVGEDPRGLVEDYLDHMEQQCVYYLITNPQTPNLTRHLEYDGLWAVWNLSKLLADRNPTVSAALYAYGEQLSEVVWNYSGFSLGPTETGSGTNGFWNYNLGPRIWGMDPEANLPAGVDASQMAVNFARFSAFSNPGTPLYFAQYGENSWPSPVDNGNPAGAFDPTVRATYCREVSRACCSHMICHDIYGTYDTRTYLTYTYLEGHNLYVPRIIGHMFLGQDVDLQGGTAFLDTWESTTAELDAVDGDWTQVVESWTAGLVWPDDGKNPEYCPFMWAHTAISMIFYYEDDNYTGEPHDSYKALITEKIKRMCDAAIQYWQTETPAPAYRSLHYRVYKGGTFAAETQNADVNTWYAMMFAWVYKQTGQQVYYNMAADLIEGWINRGYNIWGKNINRGAYSTWWAFQWLGWTSTEFKLPWKFDIAGGESWP